MIKCRVSHFKSHSNHNDLLKQSPAMRIPQPIRSISHGFPLVGRRFFHSSARNISSKPRNLFHFLPTRRRITMAGEPEIVSITSDVLEESAKYGFGRSEMFQNNLSGTVDPYERHVFLCYKSHELWPPRVEDSDSDPFPKLFDSAFKARRKDITVKTRVTIYEGGDDVKMSDGDVLIFPEMIIYRGLTDPDMDSFVEDVLVNGKPWAHGVREELTGSYVFVCAHNNRDRRCGVCGPILIQKFKEAIQSKDLKNQITVAACSHIGGHKYAGNIITFSTNTEGKVTGNWYGYVTPDDVLELIDKQFIKGEVVERLWRGQMGTLVSEAVEADELRLSNGTTEHEKQPQVSVIKQKAESVASCCQGANGSSCCRDENLMQKPIPKEVGGISRWTEKLEKRHVLATAALVSAVAAVIVAHIFLRKAK